MLASAALLSLVAGLALGLLGGGGSLLTVPILVYVLGVEPRVAIATSLVVVGATSAASAGAYARKGSVDFRTGLLFGGAGMAGAMLGAKTSSWVSPSLLLGLFGALVVSAAWAMWHPSPPPVSTSPKPPWLALRNGAGVGLLTGLVGAGGGFIVVPALVLLSGLPMTLAVGTSLFIIALNCTAGLASSLLAGVNVPWALAGVMSASAMVGSLLGVRLGRRFDQTQLRRAFSILIAVLGGVMLVRETLNVFQESGLWAAAAALLLALGTFLLVWRSRRRR